MIKQLDQADASPLKLHDGVWAPEDAQCRFDETKPVDAWPEERPRPEVADDEVTICGELCTPKDTLAHARVGRLRAGDVVVFEAAGAYGWDISHHDFLRHDPPTFLIT